MEPSNSNECISFVDGMDEEGISQPRPFSKPSHNNANNGAVINPATSVHELLECPVCTNSMYPPIHQVFLSFFLSFILNL